MSQSTRTPILAEVATPGIWLRALGGLEFGGGYPGDRGFVERRIWIRLCSTQYR